MQLQFFVWATTSTLLVCLTSTGHGQEEFGDRISNIWRATSPKFAEQGQQQQFQARDGKSLVSTFPFNAAGLEGQHHHHDHGQEGHSGVQQQDPLPVTSSNFRAPKQQKAPAVEDVALDIGSIAAAGERCVDKVVTVEETEYDDEIHCKHSYSQKCHLTYATDYEPQQEEECEENFKKRCFIEYKNVAKDEPIRFCFTPLVRNCNIPGPTECTTEYRSECTTTYHEHDVDDDVPNCVDDFETKCQQVTQGYSTNEECTKWPVRRCDLKREKVKKYSPQTECKKVPFELCGPSSCPVQPGPEECQDKTETIVQEVPEENCTLEPQRACKHVTKLVPSLKARENCLDIPKEVCGRRRTNPRRVSKPVLKKWCYTPTKESGLLPPPPPPPTRRPITGFGSGDSSAGGSTVNIVTQEQVGCIPGFPVDYCPSRRNNGRCDPECNVSACGFDNGECQIATTQRPVITTTTAKPILPSSCSPGLPPDYCPSRKNNGRCDPECNISACGFDNGECQVVTTPRPVITTTTAKPFLPRSCSPNLPPDYCPTRRNNKVCDQECNNKECGFDGGDCRPKDTYLPPPTGYQY